MPKDYVPFKDRELCERLRLMSGKELEKREPWHHPEFNIKVMVNPHPVLIAMPFTRLKAASEAGRTFAMILGNPEPDTYIPLAQLINYFQADCSKVHIFAMDEWADDMGNIAPETYEAGFAHSMLKYLVYQIDPKLRMPMENVYYPTNATIGPVDVKNARERMEVHALLPNGTFASWQRMTSRLVLNGPVTPEIPSSMLQTMKTQVLVSDELAASFECWEKVGY